MSNDMQALGSFHTWYWGSVYTTVEKASGRSRMFGQDMVIWGKQWMCRWKIKGNKIFLIESGFSGGGVSCPASWGRTKNSSSKEAQLQKVPPRRQPCHFIIHEKSSLSLFSSPSVNTHRSRVAFLTNHNWETRTFSMTGGLLHRSVNRPWVSMTITHEVLSCLVNVNARWMYILHGFLHGIKWIMFMVTWTI